MGVEQQQKVLYVWYHLLQSEVTLSTKEMIGLLFELADRVISRFKSTSYSFMPSHHTLNETLSFFSLFSLQNSFNEPTSFNRKHIIVSNNYWTKDTQKMHPLWLRQFGQDQHLSSRDSLLSKRKEYKGTLKLSLQCRIIRTIIDHIIEQLEDIYNGFQALMRQLLFHCLNPLHWCLLRKQYPRIEL